MQELVVAKTDRVVINYRWDQEKGFVEQTKKWGLPGQVESLSIVQDKIGPLLGISQPEVRNISKVTRPRQA